MKELKSDQKHTAATITDFACSKIESGVSFSYETMNCFCGRSVARAIALITSIVNNKNFMLPIFSEAKTAVRCYMM